MSCPSAEQWPSRGANSALCKTSKSGGTTKIAYKKNPGLTVDYALQTNNVVTNSFAPYTYIYDTSETGSNGNCEGKARYGCNSAGKYNEITLSSAGASYTCNSATFGGDPYFGQQKDCSCLPFSTNCAYSFYTTPSSSNAQFQNQNNYATAKYVINQNSAFTETQTLTFQQDDHMARRDSATTTFEFTVCGLEKVNEKASGKLIWIVNAPTGTAQVKTRGNWVFDQFTWDYSTSGASTSCDFGVFQTYTDSGCSTALTSDAFLAHAETIAEYFGHSDQRAHQFSTTNKMTLNAATAFAPKTYYLKVFTDGRVESVCKQLEIEVCGWETVGIVDSSLKEYQIEYRTGGSYYVTKDSVDSWFTTNSNNCQLTYSLRNSGNTGTKTGTQVQYDADGKTLKFYTNGYYSETFYVRATSPSGITKDRQVKWIVCYKDASITVSGQWDQSYYNNQDTGVYSNSNPDYYLNSYSGSRTQHTISAPGWFSAAGPSGCTYKSSPTFKIYDDAKTAEISSGIVTVDGTNQMVWKTDTSVNLYFQIRAETTAGVVKWRRFRYCVCGQETLTPATKAIKFQYKGQSWNTVTHSNFNTNSFTNSNTRCWITFSLEYEQTTGNWQPYTGTYVYFGGNSQLSTPHMYIKTDTPFQPIEFRVKGVTGGQVTNYRYFQAEVCGWETYTCPTGTTVQAYNAYRYQKNDVANNYVYIQQKYQTFFSTASPNCMPTHVNFYEELVSGCCLSYVYQEAKTTSTQRIYFRTDWIYDVTLKFYVTSPYSGSRADYYMRVTICNNYLRYASYPTRTVTAITYNLNIGEQSVADCQTYFQTTSANLGGSNCKMRAHPICEIKNDDTSTYSGGLISIDAATSFLKIKTTTPINSITYRIYAYTLAGISEYHQIRVHVCGQEVLTNQLGGSTVLQNFIAQRYEGTGNVKTYNTGTIANTGKTVNLYNWWSNSLNSLCPITKFNLYFYNDATALWEAYTNSDIQVTGSGSAWYLRVDTTNGFMQTQFRIEAETGSAIKAHQEVIVIVCGYETVALKYDPNKLIEYKYKYGLNVAEYPVADYTSYFSVTDTYCPITTYKLETESGGVYSTFTDVRSPDQFTLLSATTDKRLRVYRDPGQNQFYIYVTAHTQSHTTDTSNVNFIKRQKIKFQICGTETISTPTSTHAAVPFYRFDFGDGGGSMTTIDLSTYFTTDQADCPVETYTAGYESSSNCLTPVSDSRVQVVNSLGVMRLQILTNPNLQKKKYCIIAKTTRPSYQVNKFFEVLVCGYESISVASTTLKYIKYGNSGTHNLLTLSSIFTSSDGTNCPIVGYHVQEEYQGVKILFRTSQLSVSSSNNLEVTTDQPLKGTFYLQAFTQTPFFGEKSFYIRVCGDEIIYQQSLVMVYQYAYSKYSTQPNIVNTDLMSLFYSDDSDCPMSSVEVVKYESPSFPSYSGTDVYIDDSGGKKRLNIMINALLPLTQFAIKAQTVSSNVQSIKAFNVTICQEAKIGYDSSISSQIPLFRYQKNSGSHLAIKTLSLFNFDNACPIVSYEIATMDTSSTSNPFPTYTGNDVALKTVNSESWVEVSTSTSSSYSVWVVKAISSLYVNNQPMTGYSQFYTAVCGNETISINDTQQIYKYYELRQGSGNSNITQRVLYYGYTFATSSESWCPVSKYELYYYNETTRLNTTYTNDTVKMDQSTGKMIINSTEAMNLTLLVKINSDNGVKPAWIDLVIHIIEIVQYDFNAAPILTEPPSGVNLVIDKSDKIYQKSIKVSEIYDDRNEPAYINFTNRDFGRLSYKFVSQNQAVLNKNESRYMTYDPGSTQLTIMIPSYQEALRMSSRNKIEIEVEDTAGNVKTYSVMIAIYKASGKQEINDNSQWNRKNDDLKNQNISSNTTNMTLVNPPDYWFAYVEKVSVVGDVIIKFNQKVDKRNFNLSDINTTSLLLYLDYTQTRVQDDYNNEDFNFTWKAVELGSDYLHIKCDFRQPFSISQDAKFDRLVAHFKKLPLFFNVDQYKMSRRLQEIDDLVAASAQQFNKLSSFQLPPSGNVDLYQNYTTLSAIVPRQIQPNDTQKITLSKILNFILSVVIFGSIFISFYFDTSIEKYMYMINELQLLFHLPLMQIKVPGNMLIVFSHLINLVKYDIFNHLRLIDFSESVRDARDQQIRNNSYFNGFWFELGYRSYNLYANIGTFLYLLIFWVFLRILRKLGKNYIKSSKSLNKKTLKRIYQRTDIDGRNLFMWGYLIIGISSLILLSAPNKSIDHTIFNMVLSILFLISLVVFPGYIAFVFKKQTDERDQYLFRQQRFKMSLFFMKRIMFILLTFFVTEGLVQVIFLNYTYMASMILFSNRKPLSSKRNNTFGMINEFILMIIINCILLFPGVWGEKMKYEVGGFVIYMILFFICFNLYFYLYKALSNLRPWIVKYMSPETRHNLKMCLSYINLDWLLFTKTREEKEAQLKLKAEKEVNEKMNGKKNNYQIKNKLKRGLQWVKSTYCCRKLNEKHKCRRLWAWLLKRVRTDDLAHIKSDHDAIEKSLQLWNQKSEQEKQVVSFVPYKTPKTPTPPSPENVETLGSLVSSEANQDQKGLTPGLDYQTTNQPPNKLMQGIKNVFGKWFQSSYDTAEFNLEDASKSKNDNEQNQNNNIVSFGGYSRSNSDIRSQISDNSFTLIGKLDREDGQEIPQTKTRFEHQGMYEDINPQITHTSFGSKITKKPQKYEEQKSSGSTNDNSEFSLKKIKIQKKMKKIVDDDDENENDKRGLDWDKDYKPMQIRKNVGEWILNKTKEAHDKDPGNNDNNSSNNEESKESSNRESDIQTSSKKILFKEALESPVSQSRSLNSNEYKDQNDTQEEVKLPGKRGISYEPMMIRKGMDKAINEVYNDNVPLKTFDKHQSNLSQETPIETQGSQKSSLMALQTQLNIDQESIQPRPSSQEEKKNQEPQKSSDDQALSKKLGMKTTLAELVDMLNEK